MNYFQQYETERKPFRVGKRFICVNPSAIGQFSNTVGEIVQITSIEGGDHCWFRCISGIYAGVVFSMPKRTFKVAYEPYTGEIPTQDEDDE
jgi:hypothetical protein